LTSTRILGSCEPALALWPGGRGCELGGGICEAAGKALKNNAHKTKIDRVTSEKR